MAWQDELRTAREKQHITQRQLAERVGMSQSHVWKIENGIVDARVSNVFEIARALGFEPVLLPARLVGFVRSMMEDAPRRSAVETLTGVAGDDDD